MSRTHKAALSHLSGLTRQSQAPKFCNSMQQLPQISFAKFALYGTLAEGMTLGARSIVEAVDYRMDNSSAGNHVSG